MKAGRNDPCPCGSGKKYKKCCLQKDQEAGHIRPPVEPPQGGSVTPRFEPPKPPPPPPDPRIDAFNARLLNFINPQYYKAAATFELAPAWLRFLESRQIIDVQQHTKTLFELGGLDTELLKVLERYLPDPALSLGVKRWRENAEMKTPL